MKKTTIRDIAEMAGVCIATVSRVINDKDNVLPEMRERVQEIIERTGYRPNVMGRGLVLRRSQNILLEHFNIADPYCVALAENVSALCRKHGCRMLLADCKYDATLEAEHLSRIRDGGVDGLIISPLPGRANVSLFRELAKSRFPTVVMDNLVPGVRLDCVKYNDRLAGQIAMDYLFEQGHKRIAFIQSQPNFQTVCDRRQSFCEAYEKRNLAFSPSDLMTMPDTFRNWDISAFRRMLEQPQRPTALLAENETVAVASMNMLLQCGVRIPEDIAVMGIGDELLSPLVPIPLTTVSLHPAEAASTAVDRLMELIESPSEKAHPQTFIQKPSLLVRQSA